MASSTIWRITITAGNGVDCVGFEEVQFRPVAGVDTPLTGIPGTASASSIYAPGYAASYAADGSLGSAHLWYTAQDETTGWWQYESTDPIEVVEYALACDEFVYSPRDWTLSYWDGSQFVVVDTRSDETEVWYDYQDTFRVFTVGESTGGGTGTDTTADGAVNLGDANNLGGSFATTPFIVAASNIPGEAGDGIIVLASPDAAGVLLPGTMSDGSITLLPATLSAAMADPLTLQELAIDGAMLGGTVASGVSVMQALDAAGNAIAGNAATGDITLQPLLVFADTGVAGNATLEMLDVSASGQAGLVGSGALLMDKPTLSATGSADTLPADGNAVLPSFATDGVMLRGNVADGANVLSVLTLSADGYGAAIATGDSGLLPLDASGTAVTGNLADGNASLSRMTLAGESSITPPDNLGDGAISLRTLDMTAGAALAGAMADGAATLPQVTLAATGTAENIGQGDAVLSAATLAGSAFTVTPGFGDGAADLPALTLRATLIAGSVSDGAVSIPSLTLSASSFADTLADGNATLAPFTASGTMVFGGAPTDSAGDVRLSTLSVTATGLAEQLGNGALALLQPNVSGTAFADNVAAGAVTITFVALAGAGYADAIATGSLTLSSPDVAATAETGHIGTASITVPLLRVDAFGFSDAIGTATLSLPALSLEASGIAGVPDPVFTGVALNTHTRAVSTYDGLAFNSLTEFNGMVLAATASGIVALTGDTDQGQPISATVTGGISDLGSTQFKRVLAGYVGYQADGALDLTMVTDGHHEYVYKLEPRRIDQIHASRVKFGRGVEGRYWQWKLANRDGDHFALDALSLDVNALSRRVG